MNFFAAQEQARKASRKLVLWFALCVLAVILLVYTVLAIGTIAGASGSSVDQQLHPAPGFWQAELFAITFVVVGGIIVIGSLGKLARLSGGGSVVARDLGGRQVDPSTRDLMERRLLNVVEEMAIASGLPVPEVWIMDEEAGINAFAAGTDPANAVIGVTRGALDQLTRAELQGVVAHEYSHILNGDMKLNMRLTGWIFGLVMLSIVGRMILESLRFVRGSRNSKGGGIILVIVLLGVAVWIIGSIGVLFARMIQAAISRQREFLADASAVQFTRLPDGISGALKKIGGFADHGRIRSAKATETRHMFFASSSLGSLLATHPPLEERIRAIDPHWKGAMLDGGTDPVSAEEFTASMGFAGVSSTTIQPATPPPLPGSGRDTTTHFGDLSPVADSVDADKDLAPVAEAKAGLLALLLDPDNPDQSRRLLEALGMEAGVIDRALVIAPEAVQVESSQRLALIDAALPLLRRMQVEEARLLLGAVRDLIEADGQIDLFEFMLQQVCERQIEIGLGIRKPPAIRHKRLAELEADVAALLAVFAAISGDQRALEPAAAEYQEHTSRTLPRVEMDFARTAEALRRMDASTPIVKRQILRLCWLTVHQDGQVNDSEAEFLRAVAEALGCALPRRDDAHQQLK